MFTAKKMLPGITHITDVMGVSFTLIEGTERAILFDTGYGMEDVSDFVKTLTNKPVTVLLSHGHHDHILGARWFMKTYLCGEDTDEFRDRTGKLQRIIVQKQAENRGIPVQEDYLTTVIPIPEKILFHEKAGEFDCNTVYLGSLHIQIIRVPGHTPGSIVIFVPKCNLLLTGDNWNPCTWMWFPTSLDARIWRNNMSALIHLLSEENGKEIDHVLCSHQSDMREGRELLDFLSYMTDMRLEEAPVADMGSIINTHQVRNDLRDWTLVFDKDKLSSVH